MPTNVASALAARAKGFLVPAHRRPLECMLSHQNKTMHSCCAPLLQPPLYPTAGCIPNRQHTHQRLAWPLACLTWKTPVPSIMYTLRSKNSETSAFLTLNMLHTSLRMLDSSSFGANSRSSPRWHCSSLQQREHGRTIAQAVSTNNMLLVCKIVCNILGGGV